MDFGLWSVELVAWKKAQHMGITGALGMAAVLGHVRMDEARIYPGDVRYLGLCVGVGGIRESREESLEAEQGRKKKEKKKSYA